MLGSLGVCWLMYMRKKYQYLKVEVLQGTSVDRLMSHTRILTLLLSFDGPLNRYVRLQGYSRSRIECVKFVVLKLIIRGSACNDKRQQEEMSYQTQTQ